MLNRVLPFRRLDECNGNFATVDTIAGHSADAPWAPEYAQADWEINRRKAMLILGRVASNAETCFAHCLRLYSAAAPTLQCAPSESTNCASTPPKSCFVGGMLKTRPLALMSR